MVITFITSFYKQPPTKLSEYIPNNWPLVLLGLLTLALAISLPLNIFAREMVVNKNNFQIHLKIVESPIKPTPIPAPIEPMNFLNFLKQFFNRFLP